MFSQSFTGLVILIDEPQKEHLCALILFSHNLSLKSFGILELYYECTEKYFMNASTDLIKKIAIQTSVVETCDLPGFDGSQFSGLRFAFL